MSASLRFAFVAAATLMACGQVPNHTMGLALNGQSCFDCHGDRYLATTDPDHVALGYPTTCEACHTTSAWTPASASNHDFWPLTGGHTVPPRTCESCHADGYVGTPTQCVGCHRADYDATTDPNHATSGFSTTCETCHDTVDWHNAAFDHDAFWPLTGKHTVPPRTCESCHADGYVNTPTQCVGCHRDKYDATTNPNHAATGFGTDCESCHDTVDWGNGSFDHESKFPIASGKHRNITCSECHNNAASYSDFSCTGCHEHTLTKMNQEHQGEVSNYQATLNQYGVERGCLHCHPDGRKHDD